MSVNGQNTSTQQTNPIIIAFYFLLVTSKIILETYFFSLGILDGEGGKTDINTIFMIPFPHF